MKRLVPLVAGVLLALPIAAQTDPFYTRVRGLTDRPFPSFQGFDCATIPAPRDVVYGLVAGPERSAQILAAGILNVLPRSAVYRKDKGAAKGSVLEITVDTTSGARTIEMTVIAVVPGRLVSFAATKDDGILTHDITELIDTFVLESNPDGTTDVFWANHYDPSSPFAAAVGPLAGRRFRTRREIGLLVLSGLARAAASLPK